MNQECQLMIWAPPVLKESAWKAHGFETLKDYVTALRAENYKALKTCSPDRQAYIPTLPLVSFGYIDGTDFVQSLVCQTIDDLPAVSIPNVLEFDADPLHG